MPDPINARDIRVLVASRLDLVARRTPGSPPPKHEIRLAVEPPPEAGMALRVYSEITSTGASREAAMLHERLLMLADEILKAPPGETMVLRLRIDDLIDPPCAEG